jgi:hypothetical protein
MKLITMEHRAVPAEYESRQLVSDLFQAEPAHYHPLLRAGVGPASDP